MMERRHQRELMDAFSHLIGDMSAYPPRCLHCGVVVGLVRDLARDVWMCSTCGGMTAGEVAYEDQCRRSREHAMKGVGAPLVETFDREARRARPR